MRNINASAITFIDGDNQDIHSISINSDYKNLAVLIQITTNNVFDF